MPKPNEKSEEPEASQPACQQRSVLGRLLDTLSSFFTPSVDQGAVQVTTSPPVPPPAKFNIGDDFRSWELLAQRYIQNVPKHRQPDALLSLLSGEALSIAVENNIVTEPVTNHTFARLKSVLTPRTLAVESARAFHERRQLEGENITTYLRQLKRLAISGFPQDTVAEREIRLLDRLVEGVTNREIRKCFLLNPPRSLSTAVDVATRCEDVRGALSSDSPNQPYYHTALARGGPNNRRRAPSRGYRSRVVGHPRWPIPLRREDCPYCQRFGNAARTCGHNDRRPPPRAMPVDSIWDALGRTLENAGNSLAERITSEVERKTQAMSDQLNTSIDDAIRRATTAVTTRLLGSPGTGDPNTSSSQRRRSTRGCRYNRSHGHRGSVPTSEEHSNIRTSEQHSSVPASEHRSGTTSPGINNQSTPVLERITSENQIDSFTSAQLKRILDKHHVNRVGLLEKGDYVTEVKRLWRIIHCDGASADTPGCSSASAEKTGECCVCMNAIIDCAFVKCGHMATCIQCGQSLRRCPICRQGIESCLRVYPTY